MAKAKKPKRKLSAYNKHMSREMKKGRTFKQAVASWPKGGNKRKAPRRRAPNQKRRTTTTRRSNTTMGKSTFNMSKIYGLVRKGAFFAPGVLRAIGPGDAKTKGRLIVKDYLGIDYATMQFDLMNLRRGWEPFFWANVVTRVVPKAISFVTGLLG